MYPHFMRYKSLNDACRSHHIISSATITVVQGHLGLSLNKLPNPKL